MSTGIEWTDETWNPIAAFDRATEKRGWFCTHVSAGCVNCYAEAMNRFRGNGYQYRAQDAKHVEVRLLAETLVKPLSWRKPRKVFACSMTDLFLDAHTDEMIDQVFAVMAKAQRHTFQVLTKRPARMRDYCNARLLGLPLPNVWLGVSVENQSAADERIPLLLETPAAVRFLSCEPLLGPVDLHEYLPSPYGCDGGSRHDGCAECAALLHWVIVGGESGKHARPFDLAWARAIVEECRRADVAVFVKQIGRRPVVDNDDDSEIWPGSTVPLAESYEPQYQGETAPLELADSHGGDMAEWPDDLRVREFPRATNGVPA